MGPRNPSRSDKMRSDDKGSRTDPRAKLTGSKSRRKYDGDTKDTAKNQNSHKTTKGSKPSPNVTAKSSKHSQGKSGRINESESEIEVESGSDIDTSTDDLSKTLARKADAGHKDKKITADPAEASMESQEVMQALWGKRGYPQINWERVPSRVRELKSWLETCLTAQSVPPFRERYVHQLFLPRRGILNDPLLATSYGGYYGPRGENQVIEELIFLLREAMTNAKEEDDIIHRNPVQYYRHVLVPATIHRFIQEDMGQNAEDALTTMEESTDLGHYFNEDCDVLEMPDNASNESASQTATNELLRDTN
ncbi:hypothetical protein H2204_011723 [Knufia peltigerae]|uniref:Restriction of telomere capping protein 4 n=1 Tax=Knufia peltigerae TaxID=1002370 RepID=A0AA38XUU6_9EURO|nr:hypothetical protein H2204_011723 [Knufia peltigerae]